MPEFAPFDAPADSLERQTSSTGERAGAETPGNPDSTRPLRPQRSGRKTLAPQPAPAASDVASASEVVSLSRLRTRTLSGVPVPRPPSPLHTIPASDAESLRRLRPRAIQAFPVNYFNAPYIEMQRRRRSWPIVIVLAGVAFACAYLGVRLHFGSSAAVASPELGRASAPPAPAPPLPEAPQAPPIPHVPAPSADTAPSNELAPSSRGARGRSGTRAARVRKADLETRAAEQPEPKLSLSKSVAPMQPAAAGAPGQAERPSIGEDLRGIRGARPHHGPRPGPLENPFR